MSERQRLRIAVAEPIAALVEALSGRLGGVELVEVSDVAAGRAALVRGEVDVAAHSYLELSSEPSTELSSDPTDGVELVAVPKRSAAQLPPAVWSEVSAVEPLALEVAAGAAKDVRRRVAKLDHGPTRLVAGAERAVLEGFAGEGTRVAASAVLEDGLLFVTATVYGEDGAAVRTASHAAYPEDSKDPVGELAARVVAELRA